MKIHIVHGSILNMTCDVIVNAANSRGLMGGGVAGMIRRAAGVQVEQEAVQQAPISVGSASLTSAGKTAFKGIIHAPTMPEPAMRIPAHHVALATQAALDLADRHAFRSVALPGMGTGVGGVPYDEAARHMLATIRSFTPVTLATVILVDIDAAMVQAWRNCLS